MSGFQDRIKPLIDPVLEHWDSGKTIMEIVELMHMNPLTIRRIVIACRGPEAIQNRSVACARRLKDAKRGEIERLLKEGEKRQKDLAEQFGLSRQRIEQIARQAGIPTLIPRHNYNDDAHRKAVEMRLEGAEISCISAVTKLAEGHLCYYFTKFGIKKPLINCALNEPQTLKEILERRSKGESLDAIALAMGLATTNVRSLLRKADINVSFSRRDLGKQNAMTAP